MSINEKEINYHLNRSTLESKVGKERKIVILLFTNKKINIPISLFKEFLEYFYYFCTVFDLRIIYSGIIPNNKNNSKFYYFYEYHYFFAFEIPSKVVLNSREYLKVLWILTEFEKNYKIQYFTYLQHFSNYFYISAY